MPTRITLLYLALAASVCATEMICAVSFEGAELLQNRMTERQLVVSEGLDKNDINGQISWAKSKDCLYLLQITKGHISVMNLNTGDYVLEKEYNANIEQLAKTLQHPEFKETEEAEALEKVVEFEDTSKRKVINVPGFSSGYSYSEKFGHFFDMRISYLWDIRTIWIEAFLNAKMTINDERNYYNLGARILYPFSKKPNTFYMGGGGGIAYRSDIYEDDVYAPFVENSFGYLTWPREVLPLRIEAFGGAMFFGKRSIGGGLRFTIGFLPVKKDTLVRRPELICSADFTESGVLQKKMKSQADKRQLVVSAEVSQDDIDQQISWAKNRGCSYLLQITISKPYSKAHVMNLNVEKDIFKMLHKTESKKDLSLFLDKLAKTLQHPEFEEPLPPAKKDSDPSGFSLLFLFFLL
ncbi:MAG: hypothetical protein FWC26_05345 [Fibromonadales bacterium]|nr:hypothetical protein [Fibromonadales bacterium]